MATTVTHYDPAKAKQRSEDDEEREMDKEYLNDSMPSEFHYKGVFVSELREYARTRKQVKIGSFTHRAIVCRVIKSDAQKVVVEKAIDHKRLMITQSSIKSIEEV
jgi:hypothetical protein